ncbi:NAD-binding protein [Nocardia cyriacigeorgica]|uniref:NAD-binding protein n=1 Tax=Nocardia cyriacigeorgica TaxID=135487 RepID=UPI0018956BD2|nr:NAD(P)-binding protein [Nocardia cyriacigeorgica]MBF6100186.1 NAD-binding protein [Nocardia cyriacigeorgica]
MPGSLVGEGQQFFHDDWAPDMAEHAIVIGYGAVGRSAAHSLEFDERDSTITVIDSDYERVALAEHDGWRSLHGDGGRVCLSAAAIEQATTVIIAVSDDVGTARIISDIREVNGSAYLCAAVHDPRWEPVVARLGADKVIAASRLTGRILGLAVRDPALPGSVQDQLGADPEPVFLQRMVTAVEVGRAPSVCGPAVVSVVRDGVRFLPGDSEVAALRVGDIVELVCPLRSTDRHR